MESLETSTLSSSLVRSSSTATPTSTPTAGLDDNTGLFVYFNCLFVYVQTIMFVLFPILLGHTLKCKQPRLRGVVVEIAHKMLINYDICGQGVLKNAW